jgi:hypothetical protein
MNTDVVTLAVKENAKALQASPVLLEASEALATIPAGLVIASDADDATWGDVAKKCGRGAKHVEASLTDLFRPMKAFEKLLREHFKSTVIDPLGKGVARIDAASLSYRREKQRRADEERRAAEQAARDAAEAVEREAAERRRVETEAAAAGIVLAPEPEPEFEDAPGIAQTLAPVVEKIVRSEETATFERRTLKCTLENEDEARMMWSGAFLFDENMAVAQFKADGYKLETDEGFVIGGVRFYNEVKIQRRDR